VDLSWCALLDKLRSAMGIRRHVTLRFTRGAGSPATCGLFRPEIFLPGFAARWSTVERRAVLLHELSHVRDHDWMFVLAARLMCALLWFHPAVWFVARRFRAECETACDDSVISGGVRASQYAELLLRTRDGVRGVAGRRAAVALSTGRGLKGRLTTLMAPGRDLSRPRRSVVVACQLLALAVSLPVATVQLAPTRGLLTQLMNDSRWESRAWAVRGLAQRPDSVFMAERAAATDPNPQVRASARAALLRNPTSSR
jgi:beta-lactamase regulating signal transducer with metallopeptidase domain